MSSDFKKQFPANLMANILSFALNMVIGIAIVPFYIKHLGLENYGLISLATSLASFIVLVIVSISAAVSRFLSISIQKHDIAEANTVFNTAFFTFLFINVALIIPVFILSYFVPDVFNVPEYAKWQSRILFALCWSGFLLGIFSSIFRVPAYANNRLDLLQSIEITNTLVRAVVTVLLLMFVSATLVSAGAAFLAGSVASVALSVLIWKKLAPYLKINKTFFKAETLKALSHLGWWVVFEQLGGLLFLQSDLIIVNLVFGPAATGVYGAMLRWPVLIRSMSSVFASVFGPMVVIYYAKNQHEKLVYLLKKAMKFMGIFVSFPIAVLCVYSSKILNLWLGDEFVKYSPLMIIMCVHLGYNLTVLPLGSLKTTMNKVKIPAIVVFLSGVITITLSVILAKFTPLGMTGIALSGAIMLTFTNSVFNSIYASALLKVPKRVFMVPVVQSAILFAFTVAFSVLMKVIFNPRTIGECFLISAANFGIYTLVVWRLLLQDDKELISSIIKRGK